jgi:hypothetical protein
MSNRFRMTAALRRRLQRQSAALGRAEDICDQVDQALDQAGYDLDNPGTIPKDGRVKLTVELSADLQWVLGYQISVFYDVGSLRQWDLYADDNCHVARILAALQAVQDDLLDSCDSITGGNREEVGHE